MIKKLNIRILLLSLMYVLIQNLANWYWDIGVNLKEMVYYNAINLLNLVLLYVIIRIIYKLKKYPVIWLLDIVIFCLFANQIIAYSLTKFEHAYAMGLTLILFIILIVYLCLAVYHFININLIQKLPKVGQIISLGILLFLISYIGEINFSLETKLIIRSMPVLTIILLLIIYHLKIGIPTTASNEEVSSV